VVDNLGLWLVVDRLGLWLVGVRPVAAGGLCLVVDSIGLWLVVDRLRLWTVVDNLGLCQMVDG
jgi:hypothetical protein